MNKLFVIVALALVAIAPAMAQMEAREYASTHAGAVAKSNTYSLRGELVSVFVDIPANGTTAVSVVMSPGGTIFSKSGITADTLFNPRLSLHKTTGDAWPEQVSDSTTNAVPGIIAMAGDVTVVTTPTTTTTNDYKVYLIYKNR